MRRYLSRLPRSTEELLQWHERYISPATLIIGFSIDAILVKNIDLTTVYFVLFGYLVIAAAAIVLYHMIQSGSLKGRVFLSIMPFVPSVMQFAFGALIGAFVILYSQSAAYATSWIFIVLLAALLIGNERFRSLYTHFAFQATIYFTVLLSFLVFFLPVMTLRLGTIMFAVSQVLAVAAALILLRGFGILVPQVLKSSQWIVVRSVASILLIFNVLYFTNAIPPIPLALKEAGVYHSVAKVGQEYRVEGEPLKWYQRYLRYNTVFHARKDDPVFVYTAVFAPTKLETTILHEWERYDVTTGRWVRTSTLGFPIVGGRDGGYRGYSIGSAREEGRWRVNVRTGAGKLIGRVAFTVMFVEEIPALTVETR